MLDGKTLGVLLGTPYLIVLGTDEVIILSSNDGEVLGSTLRALDDFTLGLNEGTELGSSDGELFCRITMLSKMCQVLISFEDLEVLFHTLPSYWLLQN